MANQAEARAVGTMLLYDEPMAKHTSWRTGGPARYFFQPEDLADLVDFLRSLPEGEPILWVGLGSNLLVRDGGFPGTVVSLKGRLDAIERLEGGRLRVGAGAACARVAREAARAGLCGVAFLAGIPGTMGGALAMNAGAFGGETWDRVVRVRTIDRGGTLRWRLPQEYETGYRRVRGPAGEWFVGCELQLERGDSSLESARIQSLLRQRGARQPIGEASAGSTFRNPPGDHAARLIEAAGLKGFAIGAAQVSPKHANFIINRGGATAADIEAVIRHVRQVVAERFGVLLEPEVKIVGEPA